MGVPKVPRHGGMAGSVIAARMGRVVVVLIVMMTCGACDWGVQPETSQGPSPYDPGFWAAPQPSVTGDGEAGDHDPRVRVFEELGPRREILSGLGAGQCVMHYRRWNGKYTPIPFRLELGRGARAPGPPRAVVLNFRGIGEIQVRALCRVPRSQSALDEAVRQVSERARQPAFVQDVNGKWQLFEPPRVLVSQAIGAAAGAHPLSTPSRLERLWAYAARWLPAAAPLSAMQEYCNGTTVDDPCVIDDIVVEVDSCTEGGSYYDAATGLCLCYSGELYPECEQDYWDNDGSYQPPSSDRDGGGGSGGDPGGADDDGGECFDERDIIVAEYYQYGVSLRPECTDFNNGGSTPHFSWVELNGGFVNGNPHYPWGMVSSVLKSGLEATRATYNRGGIRLSSGYRCPHGNQGSGGASNSFHMYGRAADMYSAQYQWTQAEFQLLRDAAEAAVPRPIELLDWYAYSDRHLHAAW